jgi:RHS repeat-associated protein
MPITPSAVGSRRRAPSVPFVSAARMSLALLTASVLLAATAVAQTNTQGATPPSLAPGAPAGSYQLTGFESINLYNGNLNFSLPLIKIKGRGDAGMASCLKIDSVKWNVEEIGGGESETWPGKVGNYASIFGGGSPGGEGYMVHDDWWGGIEPGYGPGVLQGRGMHRRAVMTNQLTGSLTRLTFTASDGTEYELRDKLRGGAPYGSGTAPRTRGTVFVTADGSSASFISDAEIFDIIGPPDEYIYPSGYLLLADGTRYRIDEGLVTWLRDRNGNRLDFQYDAHGQVQTITDSLGRQVTFTYAGGGATYDQIIFSGFGGAPRTIKIHRTTLDAALMPGRGYTTKSYAQLFPEIGGLGTSTYNPTNVVSAVELTDGRRYQLFYNPYNELVRVELPTGGAVEYDYTPGSGAYDALIHRRVVARRVFPNGGATWVARQTYGFTASGFAETPRYTDVTVEERDAAGALLGKSLHKFAGSPLAREQGWPGNLYSDWKEAREHTTVTYGPDGVTPLRQVRYEFAQRETVSWWTGTSDEAPPNDVRVAWTETTLSDANLISKQSFAYDQYGNLTDTWDYDFGSGAPPAHAARHTQITYLTTNPVNGLDYASPHPTAGSIHLRSLPQHSRVYSVNPSNGAETQVAHTETVYDETALQPWYGAVTQWADPGAGRGNPTKVRRWLDRPLPATYVETRAEYDQAGNVSKSWDAMNNLTGMSYSATHHYALPTQTTSPVPDPTNQYGSNTALVTTIAYDFSTGLVTSTTDANNQTTTLSYADESGALDPLDRLRKVVRPGGMAAGGGGQTLYDYGDTAGNLFVRTRTAIDASRSIDSYQYFDGLGRAIRVIRYENQDTTKPWVTADTEYDALGRVKRTSLPYRAAAGAALFSTDRWTETAYDALGRVKAVKTMPDTATVTTDYHGNAVTVTDQAGRKRRSVSDAMGRLSSVTEAPEVATCQPDGAGCSTCYTYDALDNLRKVDQSGQLRFFMYDSMGRLVRAKNPEQGNYTPDPTEFPALTDPVTSNAQWSLAYVYDAAGNLSKRKDARAVKTTYGYDALGRNTTVRYTDGTKDIDRHYDGATNGRGRFHYFNWDASNNARFDTHLTIDEYDAMGRPKNYRQHFLTNGAASPAYTVERTYDLAGNVTSQKYPSGRSVSYRYDLLGRPGDHNGQPAFSGNLGDGVQRTYADELRYHELGGMEQERFGTDAPLYHKRFYNVRGQLGDIRLSTYPITAPGQAMNWNRGAVVNHYSQAVWGGSDSQNNGNLRTQQVWVPSDDGASVWALFEQSYAYDALNRLKRVGEGGRWQQEYDYDRWGNRTVNAAGTWLASPSAPPTNLVNERQFDGGALAATNRLYAPGDTGLPEAQRRMRYDAAGNLTQDYCMEGRPEVCARAYDAEGRMTSAQFLNGQVQSLSHTYDADGRRVKRGSLDGEVWQVYGMEGELLAEYAPNAAASAPRKEYGYRAGELLVTAEAGASAPRVNVALASNGATASASSTLNATFPVASVINGDRRGTGWGSGGGWNDATGGAFPDWVEVSFAGTKTIGEVSVFTLQDSTMSPSEPTEQMTFSLYGVTAFQIEYWTGSAWAQIPGASASGNNKVWRKFTFAPVTTQKIRVMVTGALANHSRITEVEAWSSAPAAEEKLQPASVTASSTYSTNAPSNAADANHTTSWVANGFPQQWIQYDLGQPRDLTRVRMLVGQDPAGQTTHQVWGGQVPGSLTLLGTLSGVTQSGQWLQLTTGAAGVRYVRVVTTQSPSWVTWHEVEVYGMASSASGAADVRWLVSDHLGTPRMVVDKSGSLVGVRRHDYFPFGEEIGASVGGRTIQQGYVSGADRLRQRFTGQQRDEETGLDYFGARYYVSTQGRFSSVDPVMLTAARLYDPQRINLYSYCRNNPLVFIDPTGRDLILGNKTAETRVRANIDANLRENERKNIEIQGNKVRLIDPSAIDVSKASPGYKYLSQLVGPNSQKTVHYYALAPGETATGAATGMTFTYETAAGGKAAYVEGTNVADVFLPIGQGPDILGVDGNFIESYEYTSFGHEAFGHGLCGPGQCAVDVENELRRERGLPLRSGRDHESLPGEREGNMGSSNEKITVEAPLTPISQPPLSAPATTVLPRPLIPVPKRGEPQ